MFQPHSIQAQNKADSVLDPPHRRDIDGLRAVAVLSVVGFHAFPRWVRSGFVGVDIFFVISGFLISSIIVRGVERGDFSFANFYGRRIRRIFPALIGVMIAGLAFGWFFLFADEYAELGKETAGGAGFVSNLLFLDEASYFNPNILLKPLVHLWSLGIEEQYYIAWPLLVWAALKFRVNLLVLTLAITGVSFVLSVRGVERDAISAFYMPQTRVWELLAGSALAYVTAHNVRSPALARLNGGFAGIESWLCRTTAGRFAARDCQSLLGAAMVILAIVFTSQENFPGWVAAPTVAGTVLVISAGEKAWLNRVILSSRIAVGIGLISFPLYLWHWPLLSFDTVVTGAVPTTIARTIAVGAAVALAWLTTRFVETPLRFSKSAAVAPGLFAAMLAVGALGYSTFAAGGVEGYGFRTGEKTEFARYFANTPPHWRYIESAGIAEKYRLDCDFVDYRDSGSALPKPEIASSCYERDPSRDKVLFIWGDSHAQMLYSGLKDYLPPNWQIMIVATSGCAPAGDAAEDSSTHPCQRSNWFALDKIRQTRPDAVIVMQRGEREASHLEKIEQVLTDAGVKSILLLGPAPRWAGSLPKIIMRRLWENTPERTFVGLDDSATSENKTISETLALLKNARYVDLYKFFCDANGCLTRVGLDRQRDSVTFDYDHLTPSASDYLAKNLLADLVTGSKVSAR